MASDEDFSDLTDLEDSDEYVESKAKKAKSKAATKKEWRVKRALKPCRATTYTTQALYGTARRFSADTLWLNYLHRSDS